MTIFNFIHFHIFLCIFFFFYLLLFHPKRMSSWLFILTVNILLRFSRKHNFSSSSGYHNPALSHQKMKKKKKTKINGKQNTWKNENPVETIIKILHAKLHLKIKRIRHHILLYVLLYIYIYTIFCLLRLSRNTFSYKKKYFFFQVQMLLIFWNSINIVGCSQCRNTSTRKKKKNKKEISYSCTVQSLLCQYFSRIRSKDLNWKHVHIHQPFSHLHLYSFNANKIQIFCTVNSC